MTDDLQQARIEAAARAIYDEWRSPDYFTWEQAVEGRNANPDPTFPHIVDKFRAQASAALTAALAAAPTQDEGGLEKRLREIGAVKRGKPEFYKDDPEDWVNAPLRIVLEAAALAAPASAEPELTETCFGLALSADDLYNVVSVSLDEADPEELQQWIPGSAVVQRTVSYSAWTLRDAPKSADPAPVSRDAELIAEAKRWVKLHKKNPYQEAAAKLMNRLVERLEEVTK